MICYGCMKDILKQRFPIFSKEEIQDLLDADDQCIESGHVSFEGVWCILKVNYKIQKKPSFQILHDAFEDWFFTFTHHSDCKLKTRFWKAFDPRSISHSYCQQEFAKMNLLKGKG
jgi:hypothetical protein